MHTPFKYTLQTRKKQTKCTPQKNREITDGNMETIGNVVNPDRTRQEICVNKTQCKPLKVKDQENRSSGEK